MALCISYTLAALVAELRERAVAGEPQQSLISWLASLVKGLGIKMRTDKCTAPQFLDLPPKNRGRQVPVVIKRGMLRIRFDTEPRRIILSRGRRGGGSRLCAECNGAVTTSGHGRTSRCRRAPSIRVRQKKKSTARLPPKTQTVSSGLAITM